MTIPMRLDPRDIWPDDVPIGTFDVRHCWMGGRHSVTGHILFVCPRGQRCGVYMGPVFEKKPTEREVNVWGWNGSVERPSLTPSIDCQQKLDDKGKNVGGCGWHGYITNGELVG